MLNPIPVGDSIAAFLVAQRPPAGHYQSDSELQFIWEGIITIIYNDLMANAGVNPGTFQVSGVQLGGSSVPVTGTGGPLE